MSRELPHLLDPQSLLSLIRENPGGWKVHELIQEIQKRELCGELGGSSTDMDLFRLNFWLLHQLFLLRRDLIHRGTGDLRVSSMDIAFVPFSSCGKDSVLEEVHPLESYYLDLDHFWETDQEDVEELLEGFWKRFLRWDNRDELLSRWGIDPAASEEKVKARVLELVKELHPDKGGDPGEFRDLWSLWQSFRTR